MKFIKQLSEDEFIVKMDPEDADPTRKIILAHDYLQFNGRDWTCGDFQVEGPYGWANVVRHKVHVQIPIRMAQDILKNVLTSDRKYLKAEHLHKSNGESIYCDNPGDKYYYTKDDNTKMVAIYDPDSGEYRHFSKETVDLILGSKTAF